MPQAPARRRCLFVQWACRSMHETTLRGPDVCGASESKVGYGVGLVGVLSGSATLIAGQRVEPPRAAQEFLTARGQLGESSLRMVRDHR